MRRQIKPRKQFRKLFDVMKASMSVFAVVDIVDGSASPPTCYAHFLNPKIIYENPRLSLIKKLTKPFDCKYKLICEH